MKKKKCDTCFGTGKVTSGSGFMKKLTGHKNDCPTCLGKGYIYT